MPYKHTDPWHRGTRRFISQTSTWTYSKGRYAEWLEQDRAPTRVPQPPRRYPGRAKGPGVDDQGRRGDQGRRVLRGPGLFLHWAGCKVRPGMEVFVSCSPKVDGVFLDELQVAGIRQKARALGTITELLFSLGTDNGLRVVDMQRLTPQNGYQLLSARRDTILGKGRGGGKPGHLELSRLTVAPLAAYLKRGRRLYRAGRKTRPAFW